jgi:hypothetical protein
MGFVQLLLLVSVRNTFGDAYYNFFNPPDSTVTAQTLTVLLSSAIFPFSNLGTPSITDVTIIVALATPLSSALNSALGALAIDGTFGPTGNAAAEAVSLKAVSTTARDRSPIPALSGDVSLPTPVAPASFTLTIPQANVPEALGTLVNGQTRLNPSQIDDIALLIEYAID